MTILVMGGSDQWAVCVHLSCKWRNWKSFLPLWQQFGTPPYYWWILGAKLAEERSTDNTWPMGIYQHCVNMSLRILAQARSTTLSLGKHFGFYFLWWKCSNFQKKSSLILARCKALLVSSVWCWLAPVCLRVLFFFFSVSNMVFFIFIS